MDACRELSKKVQAQSWTLAPRKGSLNNAFLCLIPSLITHVIVQGEKREWDTSPLIHFWHRLHHQHHVGHPPSSPSWPSWTSPWSSSSSHHHVHHHPPKYCEYHFKRRNFLWPHLHEVGQIFNFVSFSAVVVVLVALHLLSSSLFAFALRGCLRSSMFLLPFIPLPPLPILLLRSSFLAGWSHYYQPPFIDTPHTQPTIV